MLDELLDSPALQNSESIPHIVAKNLNVRINDNHILKNINIVLPDKSITCIIGPSGCGKTTLLRTFNRMNEDLTEVKVDGELLIDGENIYGRDTDVIRIRKKMGLLSQRPCPLPMSIYDNVAYGPKIHGIRRKNKLNKIVERYLKAVGLWDEVFDRLNGPATRLSIGQQQRLCLARGLAVEPEIILGDEATSALDPVSTMKIEELFVKLKKYYSIVLVTHTFRQAKRIADNVIFMYNGEIIEFGPTDQIFNNPQNELTQKYVSGNFG